MENIIALFGGKFYIDLDSISEMCKTGKTIKNDDNSEMFEINIFKYEIIKMCVERVLSEFQEVDEMMGAQSRNETSVSFKLAFNTLLKNKIIIEDEDE